ncbi:ATPase [Prauserella marina]|uniref:histidine kinase n=1 Tax=Prauserella marina TaxID=530584 RepID=A0A222VJH2_9PSEU|nr:histidine kinase [Prauserella marina]ASR34047.1 ATPase [Prauserella marina]PWV82681.1 signal transduction histidine kinase [Prauserella marina]SDC74591.1 Signal transduction histidine kinase [Prauserella marina]
MTESAQRALRTTTGLALGAISAFAELVFVVFAVPALVSTSQRPRVFRLAHRLSELERARLARYLEGDDSSEYSGRRAMQYLALRWIVGGLGAGVFLLIGAGVTVGGIMVFQLVTGQPIGGAEGDGIDWYDPFTVVLAGVLLGFLAVQGLIGVAKLDRRLAERLLGPSGSELLRRRVLQLAVSRANVLDAVHEERRRIERDLHDGVQQRLVALGMVLGRALRAQDPDHANSLLQQAHEESQQALLDLREVTWRVYPIALDGGGLAMALESLAERSGVPVSVDYTLADRLRPALETVAYFVASEAVTNAVKHAAANRITIAVHSTLPEAVVVRVTDDGTGGAIASGEGLSGLARRVGAVDGKFTVDSPAGGPTVVTAVLPCA